MSTVEITTLISISPSAQDFEVGKEYKRTVQFTNISYTVNTCKMVGLSEELKDFISIKYVISTFACLHEYVRTYVCTYIHTIHVCMYYSCTYKRACVCICIC